ncbi:hypothetical protein COLO4_20180 [Corchorus olitorius]|uniref:Protein NO VEIN C-terminal domain-containing protein n=1 Tax=Corchorus olitorius TaxID=93759 RepID=A0A1R3J1F4_9ROSI|nr:hypothetical protein COLO4_20180 [Corchorus olitorius]
MRGRQSKDRSNRRVEGHAVPQPQYYPAAPHPNFFFDPGFQIFDGHIPPFHPYQQISNEYVFQNAYIPPNPNTPARRKQPKPQAAPSSSQTTTIPKDTPKEEVPEVREKAEQAVKEAWQTILASGRNVTTFDVSQKALATLQADSWSALGLDMKGIPSIQKLLNIEARVNVFIQCFILVRRITTVYELEMAICENEGVSTFEKLEIGPLLRHPLALRSFALNPDAKEVLKITSDDIIAHLQEYMEGHETQDIFLNEFLDFVAEKQAVASRENLGIHIRNLTCVVDDYDMAKGEGNSKVNEGQKELKLKERYINMKQQVESFISVHKDFCGKHTKFDSSSSEEEDGNDSANEEAKNENHESNNSKLASQISNSSDRVNSCPYPSATEELTRLGLTDGTNKTSSANAKRKRTRSGRKRWERKRRSLTRALFSGSLTPVSDRPSKLSRGDGLMKHVPTDNGANLVRDVTLPDNAIKTFVTTWKEACREHDVAEVLQRMLCFYKQTERTREQMKSMFSSYPFIGLLNVALIIILNMKALMLNQVRRMHRSSQKHKDNNILTKETISALFMKQFPMLSFKVVENGSMEDFLEVVEKSKNDNAIDGLSNAGKEIIVPDRTDKQSEVCPMIDRAKVSAERLGTENRRPSVDDPTDAALLIESIRRDEFGEKNHWVPPCKVLRGWTESARKLLPEALLYEHLCLGYLDKDIVLSDALARALDGTFGSVDEGGNREGCKYLLEVLDRHWDYYSEKATACCNIKSDGDSRPFRSSFLCNICDTQWVVSSMDDKLHYPKELFHDCDAVRSVLGACAPYAVPKSGSSFENQRHFIRSLSNVYPGLHDFFVNECKVPEKPSFCGYLDILVQLSKHSLPSKAAKAVFQVFREWADGLKSGFMSSEDIYHMKDCLTKSDYTVLPTVLDKWVSLHSSFGLVCWCDDESLGRRFRSKDNIDFLHFGALNDNEKELLRTQVSSLIRTLGIPVLSEVVTREAIYCDKVGGSFEASMLNWALPFAQRYLYCVHPDNYVQFKQSGFDKIKNLEIVVVRKLHYRNVIKSHGIMSKKQYECTSLLQDNILYTTRKSDSHALYMEFSRLLFGGTPDLHLANFLHMVTTMAKSGSNEEQTEFFILNSQKVPKLPDEEPAWSLSFAPCEAENNELLETSSALTVGNEKSTLDSNKKPEKRWPPVDWKKEARRSKRQKPNLQPTDGSKKSSCHGTEDIDSDTSSGFPSEMDVNMATTSKYPNFPDSESMLQQGNTCDPADCSGRIVIDPSVDSSLLSDSRQVLSFQSSLRNQLEFVPPVTPGFVPPVTPGCIPPEYWHREQLPTGNPIGAEAKLTGKLGELAAFKFFAGRFGETVKWVNRDNETGLPYDLVIEGNDGHIEYIEVKTTRFGRKDWFKISTREWQFGSENGDSFSIAHVFLLSDKDAVVSVYKDPIKLCQQGKLHLVIMLPRQPQW